MSQSFLLNELIEALAEADSVEPDELSYQLHDYMDPEVLTNLESMDDSIWEFTVHVSDHQVTITHERRIFVDGVQYRPDTSQCA